MGTITKTKTWADNENVAYTDLNADFDSLYNEFNGNIDNDNIKSGAAISPTKISGTAFVLTNLDTDGTLAANSDTKVASQKATRTYVASLGDWKTVSATLTYSAADAPTFVVTTSVDLTGTLGVGTRIRFSQTTGGTKYFIVTAIDASSMTLYGGTDYTLTNETVTSPVYSTNKAPLGFPLNPNKWTETLTDTSDRTQASPVQNTWYNTGSLSLSIPIGLWNITCSGTLYGASSGTIAVFITFSTANNSESDVDFTSFIQSHPDTIGLSAPFSRTKTLSLVSKTSYFLNTKTNQSGVTTIGVLGSVSKTIVRAVSAYL